jgi:hypothetical protein
MEQDTIWMVSKANLSYKLGRQKKSIVTGIAIVLVAYVLCTGIALFGSKATFLLAQPLIFLAAGALHVYRMNNDLRNLTVSERWVFTLALTVTLLLLFTFFFFWNQFSWFMIFTGPSAFVLPFVLVELYRLYFEISYADARPWHPTNELSMSFPDIYVNGIPVCFKIIQGEGRSETLSVDFLPSVRMKPGEILVDIAQKQIRKGETEVPLFSADEVPFRWIFLTSDKLLWKRALDPNLTLSQNKIKYGNVIYALRMTEEEVDATLPDEEHD